MMEEEKGRGGEGNGKGVIKLSRETCFRESGAGGEREGGCLKRKRKAVKGVVRGRS